MKELFKLSDLCDYTLHANDGDIGRLLQVYFDDRDWQVRYLVVRSGGWLLGREVLLSPDAVTAIDPSDRRIDVALDREQIRNAPATDTQMPVSRHYETELFRHYGWDPYWGEDMMLGASAASHAHLAEDLSEPEHPHLRSSAEVVGYRIHTDDEDVGHVRDLLVGVPGWNLRYLDVKAGGWLFGRDILLACAWLEGIDWAGRRVATVLSRQVIEAAPSYDPRKDIGRDYELTLYRHYGKEFEQRG